MVDLFRERKWDLVGHRKLWFAISLAVILTGLYFLATQGLNRGIDFTGGGLVTYQLAEPVRAGQETVTLARAREAIQEAGVDARLQISGTATRKDQLLVRTRVTTETDRTQDDILTDQSARMQEGLAKVFPGVQAVAKDMVTPVVSEELMRNAVWAVLAGCVFILVWIRIRYFDFRWAGAALLALAHDVLVLVGVFAITQREINSPFVAAVLTVVGYSVHDTIVLFDRIRENLRLRRGSTFAETANRSLLETMARSVNTVLTVLFVLVAVYLLGGASLRDFTFALIVGITAGGYSSIFVAAQVLVVAKNREERAVTQRRAAAGRPGRETAVRSARPSRPAAPRVSTPPAEGGAKPSAPAPPAERPAAPAGDQKPRSARRKLKAGRKRRRRF